MAITAWSANVWRSAICLSEKGRTSARRITMAPERSALAQQWRGQHGSVLNARACLVPGHVSGNSASGTPEVLDVDRPSLRHGPAADRVPR